MLFLYSQHAYKLVIIVDYKFKALKVDSFHWRKQAPNADINFYQLHAGGYCDGRILGWESSKPSSDGSSY